MRWLTRILSPFLPAPPTLSDDEDVVVVDVRSPGEFAGGHIQGAVHIPLQELPRRWRELRRHRDERMLVYCRSGRRSGMAVKLLRANGFARAENGGGIGAMRRAGLDLVRP
jgi:phage shock protein E